MSDIAYLTSFFFPKTIPFLGALLVAPEGTLGFS